MREALCVAMYLLAPRASDARVIRFFGRPARERGSPSREILRGEGSMPEVHLGVMGLRAFLQRGQLLGGGGVAARLASVTASPGPRLVAFFVPVIFFSQTA